MLTGASIGCADDGTGSPGDTREPGDPVDVTSAQPVDAVIESVLELDPLPSAATSATTAASTGTVLTAPPSRIDGDLDAASVASGFDAALAIALDPAAGPSAAGAGVELQLLFRYLANHADLDADVLAALDPLSRTVVAPIVTARQFGQARAAADPTPSPPSPTLPAWTIVEPFPAETLRGYYDEAEAITGVPWFWLAAINLQETRMGRIVGVSSAGAVGPMQFLPSTWAECCIGDPTVPRDAIIGAATYLLQSGAPGDMQAAVHQYNPNDSYVITVTAYAEILRDHPALLAAFHAWQVFAGSSAGTIRLPVGYSAPTPVDAAAYATEHPDDLG